MPEANMNEDPENAAEGLYRIMESNAEALTAIGQVVDAARRELRIFDANPRTLHDRGFGAPARIEMLRKLLLADRANQLRIALHDTAGIESELPRLVALLGNFSSQVRIHRTLGEAAEARDVMIVADDLHCWRKPHIDHPRSIVAMESAADARQFLERFEEIWEKSEPAVSSSTLGL